MSPAVRAPASLRGTRLKFLHRSSAFLVRASRSFAGGTPAVPDNLLSVIGGTCLLLFTVYHLRFTCLESLYLQTPDLDRDCRHRHPSRLWRGVAGDLDVVSSLPFSQISRRNRLAAGNDSATPGEVGRLDW